MKTLILMVFFLNGAMSFAQSLDGRRFDVTSKKCGETEIALSFPEEYRFIQGQGLGRVFTSSDTDTEQCRTVLAYQRSMEMFSNGFGYSEISALIPRATKTACFKKENGEIVRPAISETTNIISDDVDYDHLMKFNFTINGTEVGADIVGSPECTTSILHLKLTEILK